MTIKQKYLFKRMNSSNLEALFIKVAQKYSILQETASAQLIRDQTKIGHVEKHLGIKMPESPIKELNDDFIEKMDQSLRPAMTNWGHP